MSQLSAEDSSHHSFYHYCQAQAAAHFDEIMLLKFTFDPTYSYRACLLQKPEQAILVLCNKFYPIVALAEVNLQRLPTTDLTKALPENRFSELELWSKIFSADYRVLPPEHLLLPADADNDQSRQLLANLTRAEAAELSYFAPKLIKDVVFNNWLS